MTDEQLLDNFKKIYGDGGDIRGYFAPGRVNLIGEHIDYNGGHVFPCALKAGTWCVARKRNDNKIFFYSYNAKRTGVIRDYVDSLVKTEHSWTNYPKGVIKGFQDRGYSIDTGFDAYIFGNIPGSGLSSSAAVEVCFGTMIADLYGFDVSPIDIALIGQDAENKFIGMNCGIMDQFASAMGKENQAIFLNTNDLSYQYVPIDLNGCKIIVANSNKPHSLQNSHYNDRRRECEEALADIQKHVKISTLCELSPEEFESCKDLIRDEDCRKRARHAVYEEWRTKEAVKALNEGDLVRFGQLLNESGDSLRYDYDATCFEIDTLVDEARKQKGVYGSRETGGGWGGNTVSIVKDENIEEFKENVSKAYAEKTNFRTDIYELSIGDGGRRIF